MKKYRDKDEMKKILATIKEITFSKHFHDEKVKLRGISENKIIKNIKELGRLVYIEDQGKEPKGHKYAFLFSKSRKYDLKVVVAVKGNKLNVITPHIQNIKRRKVYEKWLKRLK